MELGWREGECSALLIFVTTQLSFCVSQVELGRFLFPLVVKQKSVNSQVINFSTYNFYNATRTHTKRKRWNFLAKLIFFKAVNKQL